MKIMLLTDRMEGGGAETHLYTLALALRAMGHEVWLGSSGGALAERLAHTGVHRITLPPPTRDPFALLARRASLKRLITRENMEVAHAHTRLSAQLLRGAHRWGCAAVVTAHARFCADGMLPQLSHWGFATIAVSEDLRRHLIHAFGVPDERITVIPNGVDLSRFSLAETAPRGILFASRLDGDCSLGAELLLSLTSKLLSRFPGLPIGIAGGGSESARIAAQADALNRSLGYRALTIHGWVEDMPALFSRYSIVIGVSRVAIEAAACKRAVVLCGNEGYLGVWDASLSHVAAVSNFCARTGKAATAEGLLDDLSRLLSDDSYRARAAAEACDYVHRHLSDTRMATETVRVYQKAMPHRRPVRIAIGGYFGCGNLGDDAMVQGLLHTLQDEHPTCRPLLLSGSPLRDRNRYRTPALFRKNPFSVLVALVGSRLFLLGGGSLLQNRTRNRSLVYYLALLRLARILRRPFALFASGIGPLLGDTAARFTKNTLRHATHIGLRDPASKELLANLGIPEDRLFDGADAAFLLPAPTESRALYLRRQLRIGSDAPLLGIILRGGAEHSSARSVIIGGIREVCMRHGLTPVFMVLDAKHDVLATRRAVRLSLDLGAKYVCPATPADALAMLASCRATVSMRLHGMILSAKAQTPALGVSSDEREEKLISFARLAKFDCLTPSVLSMRTLLEHTERLLATRSLHRERLPAFCEEMRKKAKLDLEKALEIVYNKR